MSGQEFSIRRDQSEIGSEWWLMGKSGRTKGKGRREGKVVGDMSISKHRAEDSKSDGNVRGER